MIGRLQFHPLRAIALRAREQAIGNRQQATAGCDWVSGCRHVLTLMVVLYLLIQKGEFSYG
jgi:hypothetical protein